MKITVGTRVIQHTEAELTTSMDTGADSIIFSFPWVPSDDKEIDKLVQPFAYPDVNVEINNELRLSGRIYITSPNLSVGGSEITLTGFSYTKDIIDSTSKAPYSRDKISLLDRAKELCQPSGIEALQNGFVEEVYQQIAEMYIQPEERIFSYIQKIARQLGILVSNDEYGNLLFLKATEDHEPVANITEGDELSTGQVYSATFDGTKRFNSFLATESNPVKFFDKVTAVSIDKAVTIPRFTTITADLISKGGMQAMADWARNKTAASAASIVFPVPSFFSSKDIIWKENTIVNVTSPTIFKPDGENSLIRSVKYHSNETATLFLLDPRFYTKQDINKRANLTKFFNQ